MALNVMFDLKDTSLHDYDNRVNDEDSLYNDEEVTYEELQERNTI